MRIYYDTEFIEDGTSIDLVSIGMVAEDGREYYAVSSEFDVPKLLARDWLRVNVWPSLPTRENDLDRADPRVQTRRHIADEVEEFIGATPDVELWAWYGAYDHVALCRLWGPMNELPPGVPMWTADLVQECHRLGIRPDSVPLQSGGEHHALADARHNRVIGDWLRRAGTPPPPG